MVTEEKYDVVIVGGGASGLMAAGVAASRGKRVVILEKNQRLGEKLRISGGGRCNITNAEEDVRAFLAHYGDTEQFLYSPFAQFGVEDTFTFFEKLKLPLVVEARKRAFPETQKAGDVVRALERYIKEGKVTVRTGVKVSEIRADGGRISAVAAGKMTYVGDAYVLATGGVSRPETGSTGDGFKWLQTLGHTVHAPSPTIVPLRISERWVHKLSGTSLSFMKITFFLNGKKSFSKVGKLLFTHFGISGPLILNSSKQVADLLEAGEVTATIDCYPDTDLGSLEDKILKVFDVNKNKMFKNVLDEVVPHGMREVLGKFVFAIDLEKQVNVITKEERKAVVHLLKALPITITGLMGLDRAVVADGGVQLEEMDMKTMRSKLFQNLYITGDLLHINRPSGGFSLQLCWTTGFVAGSNV